MSSSWPRRIGKVLVAGLLLVVALFLVGRGVVEVASVDPGQPVTYRDDWGGPSYPGVLLVHAGPGLAVLVLVVLATVRRTARVHQRPDSVRAD